MSDVNDLRAQRDELDRRIAEAETGHPAASTVEVTVTAGELLDRHIWTRACDLIGFNSWAINEGQMDRDERLAFTLEQARELGLLEAPQ
jgi:hypothetical protein